MLLLARQAEYLLDTKPDLKEEILKNMDLKANRQLKRIRQYSIQAMLEEQRLEEERDQRLEEQRLEEQEND